MRIRTIKKRFEFEKWKPIVGYESMYKISTLGRIKALPKMVHTGGGGYYLKSPMPIKLRYPGGNNYVGVGLHREGKSKTMRVHQIMGITFLGYTPNRKTVIHHVDEVKFNNRLSNLEVRTQRYNASFGKFHIRKSSEFIGVSYNKKSRVFKSSIIYEGVKYYLGSSTLESYCSKIYQDAVSAIENNTFYEWKNSLVTNKNKSSKYKGVHYCTLRKRWESAVTVSGVIQRLGGFKTEYAAHIAYEKAREKLKLSQQSIKNV